MEHKFDIKGYKARVTTRLGGIGISPGDLMDGGESVAGEFIFSYTEDFEIKIDIAKGTNNISQRPPNPWDNLPAELKKLGLIEGKSDFRAGEHRYNFSIPPEADKTAQQQYDDIVLFIESYANIRGGKKVLSQSEHVLGDEGADQRGPDDTGVNDGDRTDIQRRRRRGSGPDASKGSSR